MLCAGCRSAAGRLTQAPIGALMKHIAILLVAISLAGCSSMPKVFANRVACTADGSKAVVASMYGPIGVASFVDDADAAAVCRKPTQ